MGRAAENRKGESCGPRCFVTNLAFYGSPRSSYETSFDLFLFITIPGLSQFLGPSIEAMPDIRQRYLASTEIFQYRRGGF